MNTIVLHFLLGSEDVLKLFVSKGRHVCCGFNLLVIRYDADDADYLVYSLIFLLPTVISFVTDEQTASDVKVPSVLPDSNSTSVNNSPAKIAGMMCLLTACVMHQFLYSSFVVTLLSLMSLACTLCILNNCFIYFGVPEVNSF
jgi:hypothetical protein